MKAFPFTDAEWAAVREAAQLIVNAELAEDAVLRVFHGAGLLDVLAGLREQYGDHPVLLETEADFATDDAERVALYQRAARIAAGNGLPILSRLALARVLLELNRPGEAAVELSACACELPAGDDAERADWASLLAATKRSSC